MTLDESVAATLQEALILTAYDVDFYDPTGVIVHLISIDFADHYVTDTNCPGFTLFDFDVIPRSKGTGPYHNPLPPNFEFDSSTKVLTMKKCPDDQDPGGAETNDPACSVTPEASSVVIVIVARLHTHPDIMYND